MMTETEALKLAISATKEERERQVETQVRMPPSSWWENLIERLEAVQCILAGKIRTDEELKCAYEELDHIVKIVREGLKAT